MLLSKAKTFLRMSLLRSNFSTAAPPAPKKIEMFINDEPYQVSIYLVRLNPILPFFKQPRRMVLRFLDFVIMKD